jgi:hypothetical protein
MERGVVVGGSLLAVSFLIAIVLNSHSGRQAAPIAQAHAEPPPIQLVNQRGTGGGAQVLKDAPGFYAGEAGLDASARAGREIWYKATAGNSRFHTYTFQQRIGVLIDWYRVLNSKERDDRFRAWGLINDPGCCVPGSDGCPAKTLDETYGFDYCPGDEELLSFVGRDGYRDPACDYADAPRDANDLHQKAGQTSEDLRQSSCDLAFGTSTGALGFRKFPNPRFDRKRWLEVNAGVATWAGYGKRLSDDNANSDSGVSHLADGSIEPPFLIGISCGSCHIAFEKARSAINTRASRKFSPPACRRQTLNFKSLHMPALAPPTLPPCRPIRSTIPARSTPSSTPRSGRRSQARSSTSGAR